MQRALDQLQIAIKSVPRQDNTIRETLLAIHRLECEQMSPELSKKLEELYHFGAENSSIDLHSSLHLATDKIIEKLSDPDASQLKKNTERLMIIIEMIYKECNYQKLCFQVADIHRIIAEKTQYRWRLDGFKRVWHRFICPNVNFCDRFSENYFVISSRPYSEFVEFQRFSVLSLCNLNKKQALSLVKKIEFDSEIKLRFLKSLDQNLYERHKSFASNPLLLNIMLLTFDNYAEIPEKLHLFYANAFETLYSKHDATKSGFRRELRSELSYDNFKKVFAQFCFITYYQAKIELTYDDIVTVLNKIKGSNGITIFRPEDYLYDLVNSICVLYREGVTYKFTHRSFQEYFSAIFLKELSDQNMEKMGISLVKKDYFRASHDSVFFMLRDMAEQRFEQNILLPFVVEFETTCSDTDKYDFYFEELSPEIFFDEVDFDGEIHLVICADFNVEAVGFIYAMARHYRDTTSSHVKQLKDAEDELRNFLISERDYKIEEKVDLTEYRDDSKLYSLLKATWIGDYLTVMANLREMLEHRRRKEEQDLFELLDE